MKYVMLCFLIIGSFNSIFAQWEQVYGNPKPGDQIHSVAKQDSIIFAGSRISGIFRSGDNGETWTSYLDRKSISKIYAFYSIVFAITDEFTLFRSIDNGLTWERTGDFPVSDFSYITKVDSIIYVESLDSEIYTSIDNGTSWRKKSIGISFNRFMISGQYMFTSIYGTTVSRSGDNGATWEKIFETNDRIRGISESEGIVYCFTEHSLYQSLDFGENWEQIYTSNNFKIYNVVVNDGNIVIELFNKQVFVSTDSGKAWEELEILIEKNGINTIVTFDNNIYIGTTPGILYSIDLGNFEWVKLLEIELYESVLGIFTEGSNLICSFADGFYFSNDGGETWHKSNLEKDYKAIARTDSEIFIKTNSGIYKSDNSGESWDLANNLDQYEFITCNSIKYDNCSEFIEIKNLTGLTGFYKDERLRSFVAEGATKFAGAWQAGVFLSTDNGENWYVNNNGLTKKYVYTITKEDSTLYVGTSAGGIFKSSIDDIYWQEINSYFPITDVKFFAFANSGIFVGTDYGMYLSKNGGNSWIDINENLNYPVITSLAIKEPYIYASTSGYGLFRRPIIDLITGVENDTHHLGSSFVLEQNYPNPFNPVTSIKYSLKESEFVTLKVYDSLGKLARVLVDEEKIAGDHQVEFDASNLSSGVYFYTIRAGVFVKTMKMVYLK